MAQNPSSGSQDENFVMVNYTHPNRGDHRLIGPVSRIDYGYRSGGDTFLVHRKDVQAQPDLFRVVEGVNTQEVEPQPVAPPAPQPIAVEVIDEPEVADEPVSNSLRSISGITNDIAMQLNAAGVFTVDDLRAFGAEKFKTIPGVGARRAKTVFRAIGT